jgi:hypothetical protein
VPARERITNVARLERVHRLTHARRTTRHGGDEPFAFIVAAKEAVELRFGGGLAHEQEEMALLRIGLEDGRFKRFAQVRRNAELEELTSTITLNIHGIVHWIDPLAVAHLPARRDLTHFQARTHFTEPGLNLFRIHTF